MITLNSQQRDAVDRMHEFLRGEEKMFLLEGSAGTGKSTCVQTLIRECPKTEFALTAPTNKATRVLRDISAREKVEGVECRTIYSLLGLRISKDSEFVQVEPLGDCDAESFDVVVVDEASMVSEKLFGFIAKASESCRAKFIFMGDPLQLPPVGESSSPAIKVSLKAELTKVERHDNQILNMAVRLRDAIVSGSKMVYTSDNDENGGVYCVDSRVMRKHLVRAYTSENYTLRPGSIKTIAWRNVTVGGYNDIIRHALYGDRASEPFVEDERVVAAHPIVHFENESEVLMVTDEEANVIRVRVVDHPSYPEIKVYALELETEFENCWAQAFIVHPDSVATHSKKLAELAERARQKKIPWTSFWDFKNRFFHDVRPCHAITAHRSQGSTYESAFVDVEDIMANRDKAEAMRCLYVAATRASRVLVLKTR